MRAIQLFKRLTACTFVLLLMIPFTVMSEQIEEGISEDVSEEVFRPEELEQMLAPIALYPDALLAQVLTAATYPLEVVEAARFVKKNPGLEDEALLEAAKDKDWEPNVKAMLEFPDLLAMMDEQLEWTKKLGDAFLTQQIDCMDAVQRLRQKAYAQGNLDTTEKQVIRVEPQTQIIIIEPARAEVVYVPVYDTAVIYGRWWYPAYPPYYFYTRRYSGISFFSGVFVGAFWGAWDCNWHSRDVYINITHYNYFTKIHYRRSDHRRIYKDGQDNQPWRHDPRHREGSRHDLRRPGLPVRPSIPDFQKYDQGRASSPAINSREKIRPTVDTSKNSVNIQPNIKKLPAQAFRESTAPEMKTSKKSANIQPSIKQLPVKAVRENVANTVNAKPIAKVDLRGVVATQIKTTPSVRADSKSSTSRSNVKDAIKDQIIVRPVSSDSGRNKYDDYTSDARGRGGRGQAANYNLQSNRQTTPSFRGSGFLREGPISIVGR